MKDKIILVDCDGVVLEWEPAFTRWMKELGFEEYPDAELNYSINKRFKIGTETRSWDLVKEFNQSEAVGTLPPLRDAVTYVRKLHNDHGYKFHCITSLSDHPNAHKYRQKNLDEVFGKGIFERLVCLATGADKDHALAEYKDTGCFWLEDKATNAIAGLRAGLQSILIKHPHNQSFDHPDIQMVETWHEVYNIVVGS